MISALWSSYSYERIEEISKYLLARTKIRPKLGVIAGSGLGGLAEQLEEQDSFPYSKIPDFPVSTVAGHDGSLVFGLLNGVPTVCMKGRFHAYEGYPLWKCAMPVRVMKLMGVKTLIVTNAAGGINPDYKPGDIMIIKDHINIPGFAGNNPLKGANDERWGPRFPAMNKAYDKKLRELLRRCASQLQMESFLREGVYCMFGGPCYETVAEVKFIRQIGSDAVGMSTIHEVIVAHHCGLKVLGISLITNNCVADENSEIEVDHKEVMAVGNQRAKSLEQLVSKFVSKLPESFIS